VKTEIKLMLIISMSLVDAGARGAGDGTPENWASWRGPLETGVAPRGNPPVEWSETKNISWKTPLPGTGHATPIVWGDRIFLLSAVPTEKKVEHGDTGGAGWMNPKSTDLIHRFVVIAVDRTSGELLWETTVREELPHSHTHEYGSWASHSPVTDGQRIYAYFGSHGLYCLDFDGKLLWERDLGVMSKVMSFGEGSSPALFGDQLIVLRDHQETSMIHVLNKVNGEVIWEMERDEPSSWSTPVVTEVNGQHQLITSATNRVRAYDPGNGKVLWECGGLTRNVIPSPVIADGILYVMSGFRGSALMAIDLAHASGDITGTDAVLWEHDRDTPYTPCPVLHDGYLYFLRVNNGFLTCLDARDGTVHYETEKLEGIGNLFASPVAAADRLYITGTNGTTCVVRQGASFEMISKNELDDSFYASPVIIGEALYLRGTRSLYCISGN